MRTNLKIETKQPKKKLKLLLDCVRAIVDFVRKHVRLSLFVQVTCEMKATKKFNDTKIPKEKKIQYTNTLKQPKKKVVAKRTGIKIKLNYGFPNF